MQVLVVNAGSSSLKLRLLDAGDAVLGSADLPRDPARPGQTAAHLMAWLESIPHIHAVGHRVVHGGMRFRESVILTEDVLQHLEDMNELAPLHNPAAVEGIRLVRSLVPTVPEVACFDTAFHATIPDEAAVYPIPWEWTEGLAVRRFGFHGLNHAYVTRRAAQIVNRALAELRIVSCHLGAGASVAAVAFGKSVDTTMGFTPLEGLAMATRSGSVDPGALLWVQERLGLSAPELRRALEHESGLLGLSGISGDMPTLLAAADQGHQRSRLAIGVYVHRLRASVAAMAASMGGVDVVVFTGGIGERSPEIRRWACESLGFLGVRLDTARNSVPHGDDTDLSAPDAPVRVVLVRAREDLQIANEVRRLVGEPAAAPGGGRRDSRIVGGRG